MRCTLSYPLKSSQFPSASKVLRPCWFGLQYLSLDLPFDEATLVEENQEYLTRTLNLKSISAKPYEGELPAACRNHAKAEPGAPAVVLLKEDQ